MKNPKHYELISIWMLGGDKPLLSVLIEDKYADGNDEEIWQQLWAEYYGWGINSRKAHNDES